MRITGGLIKGRQLASLKGLDIRPTSDLVRESIFNLIGQDFSGARVLDLFAGTGSLGIEALSRGASWALFIDSSPKSIGLIKRNLRRCGLDLKGFILRKDLTKGLPRRSALFKEEIDLVFIDPPYGKGWIPPLLGEISERRLLSSQSIVVAELSKTEMLPATIGKLQMVKARTYGETKINIFNCEDDK
ncbi:MAG: 16S rRNA (guanine(966)-N(2))-methyltransferase RsmD [Desulfobacteraceae bacterium]|jgi:16S rRNA (guanine966-N2)-methyltransferase